MGTTSSVPALLEAIHDALATALPLVQVSFGFPGDTIERECFWLAGAEGAYDIPNMRAGRKQRDETYEVKAFIDVLIPAGTQQEALNKAYTHFAALEDLLANDPSIAGVVTAATAGRFVTSIGLEPQASWCRIELGIDVEARLT